MKNKSQNWVDQQASFQSPLQKLVFGNSNQILLKKDINIFCYGPFLL